MNVCSPYFVTSHIYKLFIVFWWIESWIEFHSRGNWLSPGHTIMHICIKTAHTRAHAQFASFFAFLLQYVSYIGHWHRFSATPTLELVMNLALLVSANTTNGFLVVLQRWLWKITRWNRGGALNTELLTNDCWLVISTCCDIFVRTQNLCFRCERLMEPIVTRSIQILTVGLATEYESYYTARHTRCCCVFFYSFRFFFACSHVLYVISIIVCAQTAGVRLRQYVCSFRSFVRSVGRSKRQTDPVIHTVWVWWRCCGATSATETERWGKMKEKNAKSAECPHTIRTHRVNVFCRKNVYQNYTRLLAFGVDSVDVHSSM